MKSGFVSLIGRPNAGKSTLMNAIVGKKIAITSNKPQTTRNRIQGIYHDKDTQIIFIDTPGIHKPNHKLGEYLNEQAYVSIEDVDVILFLIDAKEEFGRGDQFILDKIKDQNIPIILVINKIDQITKEEIITLINHYQKLPSIKEIVPISALKKKNIHELMKTIRPFLSDSIAYYDDQTFTDRPRSFMIAEIVREKIFEQTREEVPHALTCVVESIKQKKDSIYIQVAIIVDRMSLKKIIIGSKGEKIKQIGIKARKELELLLEKKVYLETFVRVVKNWRDKEKYLSEFGFHDKE